LDTLSHLKQEWTKWNWNTDGMAALATPAVFSHIPDFGDRFRGSGRLHAQAVNPAESTSYYLCLDLSKQWGLSNRCQTLILMLRFCSWHHFGLVILWEKKEACDADFEELFKEIDLSEAPLNTVPFVRWTKSRTENWWRAPKSLEQWCIGTVASQCEFEEGSRFFFQLYHRMDVEPKYHKLIRDMLPKLDVPAEEALHFFLALKPVDEITETAMKWMRTGFQRTMKQIAVHVRRGDHKWFNLDMLLQSAEVPEGQKQSMKQAWREADYEVEVDIERYETMPPLKFLLEFQYSSL
jgi:hypothetical protein